MEVILIGAGRYGNNLVGSKYSKGEYYGARIGAVADPNIEEIKKQQNYNFQNIPAYDSFSSVPLDGFSDPVAELAVIPKHIEDIFGEILTRGIKKIILPKPVSSNYDTYEKMVQQSQKNQAKTLVASNWHYSDITRFTKAILDNLLGKKSSDSEIEAKFDKEMELIDGTFKHDFYVKKVEIEYSKKNEVLTIDPPSQEMPHALQIVHSVGLMDLDEANVQMKKDLQSKSAVNVELTNSDCVKEEIKINSDLQKGDKTDQKRERTVKIYLDDEDDAPDIVCDYDARFENSVCTKHASVSVDITKNGQNVAFKKEIVEDNMDRMYESMFHNFQGEENNALTLEGYDPVAKKISQIQQNWEDLLEVDN